MSTSDSTIKGKFDELAGKTKQAFGDATGDQSAANSGAAQEIKGHGEQAWGSVKEAAHDSKEQHEATAADHSHGVRDTLTSAAADAKAYIQGAADDFKKH